MLKACINVVIGIVAVGITHLSSSLFLLGTTKRDPKYNFAVMDDIAVYPADKISTPVGKMSVEWLKTLEPSILNMRVPTYKHAM